MIRNLLIVGTVIAVVFVGTYYCLLGGGIKQYEWSITDAGIRSADQTPLTSVTLRTQSTSYPVGVYEGKCLPMEQPRDKLLGDELAAVICLWMGRGTEIGVFQVGHAKEVRTIHRVDVTTTTTAFRDEFRTDVLFELNANDW